MEELQQAGGGVSWQKGKQVWERGACRRSELTAPLPPRVRKPLT